jgi:hypothetical protein
MHEKFRKRSQTTYPPHYERIAAKKRPFFRKNECLPSMIQGTGKTKPNEAKWVKPIKVSEMHEKFRKRSQMIYPPIMCGLQRKNGPFSQKMNAGQQ